MFQALMYVGLGGMGGAILRFFAYSVFAQFANAFVATLFVNIIGSFFIGLVIGFHELKFPLAESLRLFICVGVLGGFTTFSAFSLDMLYFLREGQLASAVLYAACMLLLSVLGVFVGFRAVSLF